jgi:hypothetical protein
MAEPRGTGRPTLLTKDIQELICQCIREGNYREVAAEWAGISKRTLRYWLAAGRKEKPGEPHYIFLHAVLEAERAAEMEMVAAVMRAAAQEPKHAQWWLERKFPERWAANRIELRELKKRIEELEKNGATRTPVDPTPGPDRPAVKSDKPDEQRDPDE